MGLMEYNEYVKDLVEIGESCYGLYEPKEWMNIFQHYFQLYDRKELENMETKEKYLLTIFSFCSNKFIKRANNFGLVDINTKLFNINEYWMLEADKSVSNNKTFRLGVDIQLEPLDSFIGSDYYKAYLASLEEEEKNEFFKWTSRNEDDDIIPYPKYLENIDKRGKLIQFWLCSTFQHYNTSDVSLTRFNMAIAKKIEYEVFNKIQCYCKLKNLSLERLLEASMVVKDFYFRQCILWVYLYSILYDKNSEAEFWELFENKIITPNLFFDFQKFLKGFNDIKIIDFIEELEKYYYSNHKEIPIDLSLIPEISMPVKDEEHPGWYVEVPKSSFNGIPRALKFSLGKLFDKLKENGNIEISHKGEDIDRNLFIYRLSGLDCPIDVADIKIRWIGHANLLGCLIRYLYEGKIGGRIPFSEFKKFFEFNGDSNLACKSKPKIEPDNKNNSTIVLGKNGDIYPKSFRELYYILDECGFTNLTDCCLFEGIEDKK